MDDINFSQIIGEGQIKIEHSLKKDEIIKISAYLSIGIFVAVLLAVVIANKLS